MTFNDWLLNNANDDCLKLSFDIKTLENILTLIESLDDKYHSEDLRWETIQLIEKLKNEECDN